MECIFMAEIKTKQIKQIKKDEPLPLLSLTPKKDEKISQTDNHESEKLWTRSLEFFEQMKTASKS